MKILITSDLYPPVINGVATFTSNLATHLSKMGHDVVVIAPSQTGKRSVEYDGRVTIHRVRTVVFPFYQNIRIALTPQLEIRSIVREFEPDIIHNQMPLGIGQAATMIGRRYDIPIISTSHAMPENLMDNLQKLSAFSRPINYMLADMGRRFHDKSDAITSPTKSGLKGFGKFVKKIHAPMYVISNGIDLEAFTPGKVKSSIYKKYQIPKNKPVITYLGRLDAEKHVWVLLHALVEVRKSVDAHMLIVGAGVDLDNAKRIADELGLSEYVTFTGRVPESDKADLHRVGKLFAVASPAELQCIAALEAMASGQPIVAVNAGALGELCHNRKNGVRFKLDDAKGAARGIVSILKDDNRREAYSQESLRIAGTHDIRHVMEQFISLYEQIVEKKRAEIAARPAGWRDRIRERDCREFMRLGGGSKDEFPDE